MEMKADVQYNDFVGTAAADISDHTTLKALIIKRGLDAKRFEPIGATFYHGYAKFFNGAILCIDNEKSTPEKKHIVNISFEAEFTQEQFFDLFKRFSVHIHKKFNGYENMQIDEELVVDDRDAPEVNIDEETMRDEEVDF